MISIQVISFAHAKYDLHRIDVVSECQKLVADGLGLQDLLVEGVIFISAYEIEAYPNETYTESPIME